MGRPKRHPNTYRDRGRAASSHNPRLGSSKFLMNLLELSCSLPHERKQGFFLLPLNQIHRKMKKADLTSAITFEDDVGVVVDIAGMRLKRQKTVFTPNSGAQAFTGFHPIVINQIAAGTNMDKVCCH
jgi:hypothetical protein